MSNHAEKVLKLAVDHGFFVQACSWMNVGRLVKSEATLINPEGDEIQIKAYGVGFYNLAYELSHYD